MLEPRWMSTSERTQGCCKSLTAANEPPLLEKGLTCSVGHATRTTINCDRVQRVAVDELDQLWTLPTTAISGPLKRYFTTKRQAELSTFDKRLQQLN